MCDNARRAVIESKRCMSDREEYYHWEAVTLWHNNYTLGPEISTEQLRGSS